MSDRHRYTAERTQSTSADHVVDTTRCADDDVDAVGQSVQVLAYCRATDARLALGIHVVTQRYHHLLNLRRPDS